MERPRCAGSTMARPQRSWRRILTMTVCPSQATVWVACGWRCSTPVTSSISAAPDRAGRDSSVGLCTPTASAAPRRCEIYEAQANGEQHDTTHGSIRDHSWQRAEHSERGEHRDGPTVRHRSSDEEGGGGHYRDKRVQPRAVGEEQVTDDDECTTPGEDAAELTVGAVALAVRREQRTARSGPRHCEWNRPPAVARALEGEGDDERRSGRQCGHQ